MILAIDPGKDKCGLAALDRDGNVREKRILAREELSKSIPLYVAKYGISGLVVGQGHFGREIAKELSKLELGISTVFVSEKDSTLEARKLFWKENKPKGFWRFIPTSLRVPPVPVDDYAAVILGKRYLKK
jgi:RNase H-fold protein (predicted Holliday junction resolvase)